MTLSCTSVETAEQWLLASSILGLADKSVVVIQGFFNKLKNMRRVMPGSKLWGWLYRDDVWTLQTGCLCMCTIQMLVKRKSKGGIDFQLSENRGHRQQKVEHTKWIASHFLVKILWNECSVVLPGNRRNVFFLPRKVYVKVSTLGMRSAGVGGWLGGHI